jgi:hypothetical protein
MILDVARGTRNHTCSSGCRGRLSAVPDGSLQYPMSELSTGIRVSRLAWRFFVCRLPPGGSRWCTPACSLVMTTGFRVRRLQKWIQKQCGCCSRIAADVTTHELCVIPVGFVQSPVSGLPTRHYAIYSLDHSSERGISYLFSVA